MGRLRRTRIAATRRVAKATMPASASGDHITRYTMYRRLERVVPRPEPGSRPTTLAISGSARLCRRLGLDAGEIVEAHYPEHNMLDLAFPDESFDYVVSDQVLEHVAGDPFRAVAESLRVLRPGGIVLHTTCFINPVHGAPSDYWRFTPAALRMLAKRNGARVIEAAGWGNRRVWSVVALGLRWQPVPDARWHPLHRVATANDPRWPVVTWLVARKPAAAAAASADAARAATPTRDAAQAAGSASGSDSTGSHPDGAADPAR